MKVQRRDRRRAPTGRWRSARRRAPSRPPSSPRSPTPTLDELEGPGAPAPRRERDDGARAPSGSGAATTSGGEFRDYEVEVDEGMVVLDVHPPHPGARRRPTSRCAGTARPASAARAACEINGKPRLVVHDPHGHAAAPRARSRVQPIKTFPVIKDLVTDVSWNYKQNKRIPPFTPAAARRRRQPPDVPGRRRPHPGVPQVHRVLPVPGRLPRAARPATSKDEFVGPRFMIRLASLEMHPLDTADRIPEIRNDFGSGYCNITQVLHRGLPRAHQHHRQRHHPAEGARRRPLLRSDRPHPQRPRRRQEEGIGAGAQT